MQTRATFQSALVDRIQNGRPSTTSSNGLVRPATTCPWRRCCSSTTMQCRCAPRRTSRARRAMVRGAAGVRSAAPTRMWGGKSRAMTKNRGRLRLLLPQQLTSRRSSRTTGRLSKVRIRLVELLLVSQLCSLPGSSIPERWAACSQHAATRILGMDSGISESRRRWVHPRIGRHCRRERSGRRRWRASRSWQIPTSGLDRQLAAASPQGRTRFECEMACS